MHKYTFSKHSNGKSKIILQNKDSQILFNQLQMLEKSPSQIYVDIEAEKSDNWEKEQNNIRWKTNIKEFNGIWREGKWIIQGQISTFIHL